MKDIENKIQILLNLFKIGKFNLVISKSIKLVKKFPNYLILYNILGSAYQNTRNYQLAKSIFIKGNKIDPNNTAINNNLANVYRKLDEVELAENLFKKIISKNPNYINAYVNYGNLKRDNNDFEMAIKLYRKAIKINEELPVTSYSLALAHQGLGEFDLAIEYAKKTLALDPSFTQADLLISQSEKYTTKNEHYKIMDSKIKDTKLNDDQKINLLFALAKADEDMGEIKKSFENFNLGNTIKRNSIEFDINKEINLFNQLKHIFDKFNFNNNLQKDNSEKNIIFILGMPRSGTSLVEQIITSHSLVFGAGELQQLSNIIEENLVYKGNMQEKLINDVINNESFALKLKQKYFNNLKRFNTNLHYITDKAPLNFRWIGLIKILFPSSKIIHCSRNPRDNCLSLYKNIFEGGLNFSYDQKELGTYYNLYLDLMNFWNSKFTNSIYEAKYELVIKTSENEIKKIIQFCGLPWEKNCLSFFNNTTPIKTMSTVQARQPIYKSSLNSFKKFQPFLKTLNNLL